MHEIRRNVGGKNHRNRPPTIIFGNQYNKDVLSFLRLAGDCIRLVFMLSSTVAGTVVLGNVRSSSSALPALTSIITVSRWDQPSLFFKCQRYCSHSGRAEILVADSYFYQLSIIGEIKISSELIPLLSETNSIISTFIFLKQPSD